MREAARHPLNCSPSSKIPSSSSTSLAAPLAAARLPGHARAGEAARGAVEAGGDPPGGVGLGVELLHHLVLDVLPVPDDVLLPVGLDTNSIEVLVSS